MKEIALLKDMSASAYGIWVLVVMAVITAIKGWPQLKKMQIEADGSLRSDLLKRIATLETQVLSLEMQAAEERARHATEVQTIMRQHDAEMRIMRHRLNNESHSLDALLMLLDTAPDKVVENVAKIRTMRSEQAQRIALEQGAAAAAAGINT